MSDSQAAQILAYLQGGHSLTPLVALDRFQCFRLAARIAELKKDGHKIETHILKIGHKRVAAYLLDRA